MFLTPFIVCTRSRRRNLSYKRGYLQYNDFINNFRVLVLAPPLNIYACASPSPKFVRQQVYAMRMRNVNLFFSYSFLFTGVFY